jgi:ribosomal-protein-serine acetyltransferase
MVDLSNLEQLETIAGSGYVLNRLTNTNASRIYKKLEDLGNPDKIIEEIKKNYLPDLDKDGKLVQFGFWIEVDKELTGFTLFSVDDWENGVGSTGADILPAFRGRGIAPGTKPHLFYLGFDILGLHRIETGHDESNASSKRSIEKTPGFKFEGVLREHSQTSRGVFENELLYAILEQDYRKLYQPNQIKANYKK